MFCAGFAIRSRRLASAGDAHDAMLAKQLREDFEAFERLQTIDAKPPALQQFLKRSTFQKTSTMQCIEMLRMADWQLTPQVKRVVDFHMRGVVATQVIEDIIGHRKNSKAGMARTRVRRPAASWCAALSAGVLTERHDFKTVSADIALTTKSLKLGPEYFRARKDLQSLPFDDIATTTQQAPYWSPKPENNMVPIADLRLLRDFAQSNDVTLFQQADSGAICDFRHRLVVKRSVDGGGGDQWYFAMGHFHVSSVLLWPWSRCEVQHNGVAGVFFELNPSVGEPSMATMSDLTIWLGAPIQ